MTVYISTGGFFNETSDLVIKNFQKHGIVNVELSGGSYKPNLIKNLIKVKKDFNFSAHNYFPPPKKPFVLNLASFDKKIYELSLDMILSGINFSKKINSTYYSFHAGFLCDIFHKDLGRKIKRKELNSRDSCINIFIKRVKAISKIAKKNGIKLMIENNVVTKNNLREFGENPFLMTGPDECKKIIDLLPNNVGLLLDVAHLKVSAKTLNFNPVRMFAECNYRTFGYHLSDNNGKKDSNKPFNKNSWFWDYIDKKKKYISIEVYNVKFSVLSKLLNLANDMIE